MTQSDIIKILEKQPEKWFSAKELVKIVGNSKSSINRSLRKLLKFNELKFKPTKKYFGRTLYLYKLK